MTVFDRFVLGLGYGAQALGAVLMFGSMIMLLVAFATFVVHYAADREDDDEE